MNRARVFAKIVCAVTGVYYASFGGLLFFFPQVFWSRIAPFCPFNEHYARDIGSFLLPLGVALLLAVSDPFRFRAIIVLAASGSALHAVSHFLSSMETRKAVISNAALTALAVLLAAIPLSGRRITT